MRARRIGAVIGISAVVVVLAVLWTRRGSVDGEKHSSPPGVRSAGIVGRTAGSAALPARVAGRAHRYQLALEVDTRPPGARAAGATIHVAGELRAIAADRDERGRERVQLQLAAEARTDRGAFVIPGLDASFDAYFDERGGLTALAFADAVTPQARNTLASIAAQLQRSEGRGEEWQADELDALGRHRVHYARTSDGVRKQKLSYTAVTADAALAVEVVRSETAITLDPEGWPSTIASAETLSLGFEHARMMVTTSVDLRTLDATSAAVPPPVRAAVIAADALARDRLVEAAADRELVDGASLSDLLAMRAKVADDQHASGYQYLRLAALFRTNPETAADAGRHLRTTKDMGEVQVLAGALGDSGASEAQRVLGELAIERDLDVARRGQAVIALGLAPSPSANALAALRAVVAGPPGELADAAWLALGNLALRMRASDPAGAARVVDELIAALAASVGDDLRLATLARALGNTGDPRIVQALAPFVTAASASVRAAALGSLRMVPSSAGVQLLIAGLGDAGGAVRASAVYAIGHHPPAAYVDALVALYRREPTPDVRREILVVAAAYFTELAPYRALLERAAGSDSDPELRRIAAVALAAS